MAAKKKPVKRKPKKKANVEAPAAPGLGEVSVSVKKIKNGWIIREEKVVRGKYTVTETFTKTKPVFAITT